MVTRLLVTRLLRNMGNLINKEQQVTNLKDVVGKKYEQVRKALYITVGCTLLNRKEFPCLGFNADIIAMAVSGDIIIEETKGHYLDSCFFERALVGFAKTIARCLKARVTVPLFVLHSFTTYKLYKIKLEEFEDILNPDVMSYINTHVKYTSLTPHDRRPPDEWYSSKTKGGTTNWYTHHADNDSITRDVNFFNSFL